MTLALVACAPRQYHPGSDDILVRDRHTTRTVKIRGAVLDRTTKEPIAGARVLLHLTMRPVQLEVVTDANGKFRARGFPAGDMGICVEYGLGWEIVGLQTRPGQRIDVTMTLPRRGGPLVIMGNHELSGEPPNCRMFKLR